MHRVVLQGAGHRKEKQEQGSLGPGADRHRAGGDGQHEKVDVEDAVPDLIPGILGGIPGSRDE